MKTPGKRTFEEQWRDAFENAELPPDASVWNKVETHLADAEANKYKRQLHTFKMRMAATVALLVLALGAGTGWYFVKYQPETLASATSGKPDGNAAKQPQNTGAHIPEANAEMTPPVSGKPENTVSTGLAANKIAAGSNKGLKRENPANGLPEKNPVANATGKTTAEPTRNPQDSPIPENAMAVADAISSESPAGKTPAGKPALVRTGKRKTKIRSGSPSPQNAISQNSIPAKRQTPPAVAANPTPETADSKTTAASNPAEYNQDGNSGIQTDRTDHVFAALMPLTIQTGQYTLTVKDIRWQLMETMWNRIAAEDEAVQQKKSKKQPHSRWQMGLGFASSRFNPNFRTESTPDYASLSNAYTSRTAVSPVAQDLSRITRPGIAYTTDVQVGFSLSERFSLQGGVQYRYDNSQLEVSQYLADVAGNRLQPVFYDVLNNSAANADALVMEKSPPAPLQASSVYVATFNNAQAQVVDNTYQYMGFPMRLVYKVLNRKVRASVGAGMSADVFVRNRIGGGANNVETIEITPSSNSAYRNLGFSGLLSLKVDYSLGSGSRYSVFIEPAYRKALTSFTASSSLESFPSWWGIGTGFQYRF